MPATMKKYDLDLSKIEDEQLVVLVQECGYRPAANELVLRYHPRMGRLIAYQAKQTPLTAHDVEDAQQNAVFALVEAIAGYNTREMLKPGGCRFRTYGRLVTMRRFWNFVKHIRRWQERYTFFARVDGRVALAESFLGGRGSCRAAERTGSARYAGVPASPAPRHQRISDPVDAAARQEVLERLSRVLEHMGERKRALWQELAAGKKLRQIACELGISYDAVKRQRRQLLAHLRTAVQNLVVTRL